tara:strand:- start:312 stop:458 length:147 start_codon:yes stop_codon:yes gene_type:complete
MNWADESKQMKRGLMMRELFDFLFLAIALATYGFACYLLINALIMALS